MKHPRIATLAPTVDRLLAQRIKAMRKLRDRDRLRAAAALHADILEATENMQMAQLEIQVALNIPVHHADQGR